MGPCVWDSFGGVIRGMDRTDKVQGGRRAIERLELGDFAGGWSLTREIVDRRAGQGRFVGSAVFSPSSRGLDYCETGTLTLAAGGSFAATRRYHWQSEGAEIAVYFEDGRFFHRFAPSGSAAATHFCDPDDYGVAYDFSDWPRWQSRWTVVGPRKDYTMVSRYVPAT